MKSGKGSHHNISVIVSSYNQPRSLSLVLRGFAFQTDRDFELIVADDGSSEPIQTQVEVYKKSVPFPVRFITQKHEGIGKWRILNRSILESLGDQLIFCDGDCVPFLNLVEVYRKSYRPYRYLPGAVIRLGYAESADLTHDAIKRREHEKLITREYRRRFATIHYKNVIYGLLQVRDKPKLLGGNFSVDRRAIIEVNGFDERFSGFGKGDSDIRNRLNNLGCEGKSLWNRAFACHLDHGIEGKKHTVSGPRRSKNRELYEENRKKIISSRGLDRLLDQKKGGEKR